MPSAGYSMFGQNLVDVRRARSLPPQGEMRGHHGDADQFAQQKAAGFELLITAEPGIEPVRRQPSLGRFFASLHSRFDSGGARFDLDRETGLGIDPGESKKDQGQTRL